MTHEERLALINKPFPPIGGLARKIDPKIWSGTIIGDNFFGDGEPASRRTNLRDMDNCDDAYVLAGNAPARGAARTVRPTIG